MAEDILQYVCIYCTTHWRHSNETYNVYLNACRAFLTRCISFIVVGIVAVIACSGAHNPMSVLVRLRSTYRIYIHGKHIHSQTLYMEMKHMFY